MAHNCNTKNPPCWLPKLETPEERELAIRVIEHYEKKETEKENVK